MEGTVSTWQSHCPVYLLWSPHNPPVWGMPVKKVETGRKDISEQRVQLSIYEDRSRNTIFLKNGHLCSGFLSVKSAKSWLKICVWWYMQVKKKKKKASEEKQIRYHSTHTERKVCVCICHTRNLAHTHGVETREGYILVRSLIFGHTHGMKTWERYIIVRSLQSGTHGVKTWYWWIPPTSQAEEAFLP